MPVGALPHLAHPPEAATLPACPGWLRQVVRGPCSRLCRVFKYSAPAVHRRQRGGETSGVISRPVVLPAPSRRNSPPPSLPTVGMAGAPPLATALVVSGVPCFMPRINPRPIRVAPVRLHVERRHITRRFTRTFISLRFIHAGELCRYEYYCSNASIAFLPRCSISITSSIWAMNIGTFLFPPFTRRNSVWAPVCCPGSYSTVWVSVSILSAPSMSKNS